MAARSSAAHSQTAKSCSIYERPMHRIGDGDAKALPRQRARTRGAVSEKVLFRGVRGQLRRLEERRRCLRVTPEAGKEVASHGVPTPRLPLSPSPEVGSSRR
jgi:hypothetical protein